MWDDANGGNEEEFAMSLGGDAAFVADACASICAGICNQLADEKSIERTQRVVLAARVAHLLQRVDAAAADDIYRAGVTAVAERELRREEAKIARAERELLQLQACVLCSDGASQAGLFVGPYTTSCAAEWRDLGAHDLGTGSEGPAAQDSEAALAAALVRTKAEVMARGVATAEAMQAIKLSEQAARGGLWMDHSSEGADLLAEDMVVGRRY